MIKETLPISSSGKKIYYEKNSDFTKITWGKIKFSVSQDTINYILNDFFIDSQKWYPLGASMTNPTKGGLGEYIQKNFKSFTPRHASAIAAILVKEQMIKSTGIKPILLKKII